MIKEDLIEFVYCCNSSFEHIIEDPIQVNCGHYLCSTCVPNGVSQIKCKYCRNIVDLDKNKKQNDNSKPLEIIKANVEELTKIVRNKLENCLNQLKENIFCENDYIETKINLAKEDIDLRVESLKAQLDLYNQKFCNELDEIRIKWKESKQNNIDLYKEFDPKEYEIDLDRLDNEIIKNREFSEESLRFFDKKNRKIRRLLDKFNDIQPKICFKTSTLCLAKESIGRVEVDFNLIESNNFRNMFRDNKYELVEINSIICDMCGLPNGKLLVSTWTELLLYDGNLQFEKKFNNIDEKGLRMLGLDTNGRDCIYISNYGYDRILKVDLNMNILATFGSGVERPRYPTGLCYSNDLVYVCDTDNRRIQVLDSELKYKYSYALGYRAWRIKVIQNTACIRSYVFGDEKMCIYFYSLPEFHIKSAFEGHNGVIGSINSHFYEYYPSTKAFYCYNQNGCLLEEVILTEKNDEINHKGHSSGAIIKFNSKLLIGLSFMKKLVLF